MTSIDAQLSNPMGTLGNYINRVKKSAQADNKSLQPFSFSLQLKFCGKNVQLKVGREIDLCKSAN